jgi:ABC-2 type transport system permease protein
MRLWFEVARRSFRRHSTYRAATYAGVFTNTVFGFIKAYVLIAVFASRGGAPVNGFDVRDAVTFAWLGQAFYVVIAVPGLDLAELIRTGDVVKELYRPRDIQAWWLAHDVGRLAFQVIVRSAVPTIVGAVFFDLRFPASPSVWLAFTAAFVAAELVCFAHRFIVSLLTFWSLNYVPMHQAAAVVIFFFSGLLVPLTLFPSWLQRVAAFTPYPSMMQTPVEVFLGKHTGWAGALGAIGSQLMWAAILLGVGRLVLAAATRKVIVQGG